MKRSILFILSVLLTAGTLKAQNVRFPTSGVIEFEKSINMYALIKKNSESAQSNYMRDYLDNYKKSNPQFKILKSTLLFSTEKSLYTPQIPAERNTSFFDDLSTEQPNIIFTDLKNNTSITQKKIYEETFLVKDSTRKINWKLTSEVRTIAGYDCRRANAIILDSIYVVAFYTDKIPVSGGPESFSGLPGMILGVALPHENITWFAKSVTDKTVPAEEFKAPVKGKATDHKGLVKTINDALKSWGTYAQTALKAFML
ncbi:MAG: GLPGLI family protein [Pedobacter sp.]|nr:MAG: GLPGLI family protein [Pedobacter sp.]